MASSKKRRRAARRRKQRLRRIRNAIVIILGLVLCALIGVIMLVIGIMQVHNYTFGKTLITLFLTVVAMLIIIFLGLLVINFITQVYSFFRGIYMELIFRV